MIKNLFLLFAITCCTCHVLVGQTEPWFSFWNKDSTLIGFKNMEGEVKIEPKFSDFTLAHKFEHIIAVHEEKNASWISYYLTKSGSVIGKDSVFFFDNSVDCENEGFIRFKDPKTGNVGMLDRNGKVVIPANYNYLSQVNNGLITGRIGAKKDYWEKASHPNCNHFHWVGGKKLLLDTTNKVLVKNFNDENNLNFYSLEKSKTPSNDSIRVSFLGLDNYYYSFIDFDKEFKQWIINELQNKLTLERFIGISNDTISWSSDEGWKKTAAKKFIRDNYDVLIKGISEIVQTKTEYFISSDGLNGFMFEGTAYEKYFNNCGETKSWIYPTMSIILTHKNGDDFTQNHYTFLRTENGYQFISTSIRNDSLKE